MPPLPIFINFPRVFLKCKYFNSCLRIVLILYLHPLKLTTQPEPKGFFSSVLFFHKHRCCPSVSVPAWWPFSRVAACWLGRLTYVGVVRDHTFLRPLHPRLSLTHSLTHSPITPQSITSARISVGGPCLSLNTQAAKGQSLKPPH